MAEHSIYKDIAERTGGDVYIGVVGPVRTGKSTFIKRFMEEMVLPNIEDANTRERAKDEMPQSAAGKTVMTTEPKFIPDNAVSIGFGDGTRVRAKLIDCVGYIVEGAMGAIENGEPRMVRTPLPAAKAMELRSTARPPLRSGSMRTMGTMARSWKMSTARQVRPCGESICAFCWSRLRTMAVEESVTMQPYTRPRRMPLHQKVRPNTAAMVSTT